MPKLPCLTLLAGVLFVSVLQAQPASLVKDIRTGELVADWPTAASFVELGGVAYFAAYDRIHGTELWRSDGTSGGTTLVRDVCPGICSSNPEELTVEGSLVFFRADDGAHGPSLWKSDGTAAGTFSLGDLRPGAVGSAPFPIGSTGSLLRAAARPT